MKYLPMRRSAFTLMELLVVIAIMALVALVAIPKLIDVMDRSRSGVQAYSLADVARMIETYNAMNRKYPDGWDTMMDDVSTPATAIINPTLAAVLTTKTLSAAQITAFNNAGIGHVFSHDLTKDANGLALYLPSDTGRNRHHLSSGTDSHDGTPNLQTVHVIDSTTSGGEHLLLNNLNLVQNKDAGGDDAILAANTFVVLGVGPRCNLVQNVIEDAPLFDAANPVKYYSRALGVFMVSNAPAATDRAKLVGVIAPDGRGKADSINNYNNITAPH